MGPRHGEARRPRPVAVEVEASWSSPFTGLWWMPKRSTEEVKSGCSRRSEESEASSTNDGDAGRSTTVVEGDT